MDQRKGGRNESSEIEGNFNARTERKGEEVKEEEEKVERIEERRSSKDLKVNREERK